MAVVVCPLCRATTELPAFAFSMLDVKTPNQFTCVIEADDTLLHHCSNKPKPPPRGGVREPRNPQPPSPLQGRLTEDN